MDVKAACKHMNFDAAVRWLDLRMLDSAIDTCIEMLAAAPEAKP